MLLNPNPATISRENLSSPKVFYRKRSSKRATQNVVNWSVISKRPKEAQECTSSTSKACLHLYSSSNVLLTSITENYLLENPDWKFDTIPEIMDGKNVADFIDPDIEEKLEALEREEERLAAEGFYDDNSDLELNSDDDRDAEELHDAQEKRMESQATKKSMKNGARLPRTAGLRTLTELSEGLTKAGLDPSRIQARAEIIAKAQGAKRKRADDAGMDVDDDEEDGEGEWMDVDGEEAAPQKRMKTNSGGVTSLRAPRTNRQTAGMRDEEVRFRLSSYVYVHS